MAGQAQSRSSCMGFNLAHPLLWLMAFMIWAPGVVRADDPTQPYYEVATDEAQLRVAPDDESKLVGVMKRGTKLDIRSRQGVYYQASVQEKLAFVRIDQVVRREHLAAAPAKSNSANSGPLASLTEARFNDAQVRSAVGNLFKLLEGAFGALIMVVAGVIALIAAAIGNYRVALTILVVSVGAFVLRSFVSLFFGQQFPDFDQRTGLSPAPISSSVTGTSSTSSTLPTLSPAPKPSAGTPAPQQNGPANKSTSQQPSQASVAQVGNRGGAPQARAPMANMNGRSNVTQNAQIFTVQVIAETVPLMAAMNAQSKTVSKVLLGTQLRAMRVNAGWYKVRLADRSLAFVQAGYVRILSGGNQTTRRQGQSEGLQVF